MTWLRLGEPVHTEHKKLVFSKQKKQISRILHASYCLKLVAIWSPILLVVYFPKPVK